MPSINLVAGVLCTTVGVVILPSSPLLGVVNMLLGALNLIVYYHNKSY